MRMLLQLVLLVCARIHSLHRRFKGFMQVYQLQTENDEEETWRDLVRFYLPDSARAMPLTHFPAVCARIR